MLGEITSKYFLASNWGIILEPSVARGSPNFMYFSFYHLAVISVNFLGPSSAVIYSVLL